MTINIETIREMFDAVLRGSVSREDASDWARQLREAHDNDLNPSYGPDWKSIWEGILFLEGIDLKDSPYSYLHNDEDIIRERP